jgi:hypothetical protein
LSIVKEALVPQAFLEFARTTIDVCSMQARLIDAAKKPRARTLSREFWQ